MIELVKARYNAVQYENAACCAYSPDAEPRHTPLYFDEVVRLLQIYAHIQPSCHVINALEGQNVFAYARIVIMSESEVMSLLSCLSLWTIPRIWSGDNGHPSGTDMIAKQGDDPQKANQSGAPLPGDSLKVNQVTSEEETVKTADKSTSRPVIVACKRKLSDDNGCLHRKKFLFSGIDDSSVRRICSKIKNKCVEHIEQNKLG